MAPNGNPPHRSWSADNMKKAILAVRNNAMGWKKASRIYKVPKTTLRRLSLEKYGSAEEAATVKRGRPTVLTTEMEQELVEYCLAMENNFFGLTRGDLRRMAYQLAEKKTAFNIHSKRTTWPAKNG